MKSTPQRTRRVSSVRVLGLLACNWEPRRPTAATSAQIASPTFANSCSQSANGLLRTAEERRSTKKEHGLVVRGPLMASPASNYSRNPKCSDNPVRPSRPPVFGVAFNRIFRGRLNIRITRFFGEQLARSDDHFQINLPPPIARDGHRLRTQVFGVAVNRIFRGSLKIRISTVFSQEHWPDPMAIFKSTSYPHRE
jgi:hypothetical protein